tara:strand:+ start:924 stop:1343 length:420 start_codon:yes stop_codon:yes gene_type:complete
MTIIDWINQVLVHKKPWDSFSESDKKTFNAFIINRWLSMDIEFIEILNYFQKYSIGTLEPKETYKLYCDVLPKGKRFNKYIKGKKSKKYNKELVNMLVNHYETSKLQVEEYIELLSKDEIISILKVYGVDKKTIKKLLK